MWNVFWVRCRFTGLDESGGSIGLEMEFWKCSKFTYGLYWCTKPGILLHSCNPFENMGVLFFVFFILATRHAGS